MQPLGSEHMGFNQRDQRRPNCRASTHPVGERRNAEIDPFAKEALALAVQWLMLAELGVHDRRQQIRTGAAAGNDMEWGRRLRDRLAGPAGELLPHRLDHLVGPWNALQRLGDRLPEFGERATAARAARRRWQYDALAGQMRWQWCPHRLGTAERTHRRVVVRRGGGSDFILGRGRFEFLELHLQLVEQLAATFRRGAEPIALHLGDQQLQMRNHRLRTRGAGLELAARRTLGEQRRLERVDVIGKRVGGGVHVTNESHSLVVFGKRRPTQIIIQPALAARFAADSASRFLRAYSRAEPR